MIKHSGKSMAVALVFPVLGGLRGEQMEKTIVCCRNRPTEIDLFRLLRQLKFRQENRMLKQVVVIRHPISRKPLP
jgi:hypothetical protein